MLRYFRTRGLLDEDDAENMLSWQGSGGFSIDASVHLQGDDRGGLERLIRYCARPPFALERLHALGEAPSLSSPQARVLYRFARPTPDGRIEIVLSPLELLERLAAFVPPGTDAKRWSVCTATATTVCSRPMPMHDRR